MKEFGNPKGPLSAGKSRTYRIPVIALTMLVLLLGAGTAKADSDDTISVTASFAYLDPGSTDTTSNPATQFTLTGDFTLDLTTTTVTSYTMNLMGPSGLGVDYTFTSLNGTSTSQCQGVLSSSCASSPSLGWWNFSFQNANATIDLSTIFGSNQLSPSNPVYLCAEPITYYGSSSVPSPPCSFTTTASFDGKSGVIYNTPSGSTSGYLTVSSDPSDPPQATTHVGHLGRPEGHLSLERADTPPMAFAVKTLDPMPLALGVPTQTPTPAPAPLALAVETPSPMALPLEAPTESPSPAPEPAVLAMLSSGIVFMLVFGARKLRDGQRYLEV